MPRMAQALLHAFQSSALTPPLRAAACAVLLAFYFGWRSSTVSVLSVADVHFEIANGLFVFSERFSKGAVSSRRLYRRLQLPASALPPVSDYLGSYFLL